MLAPLSFFRQVRAETRKVVWPSRKETLMTAVAVVIMVVLVSIFLFLADQVLSWAVRLILDLGV